VLRRLETLKAKRSMPTPSDAPHSSSESDGGILPTVDSSSSLSTTYVDFFTNSLGLLCINTTVHDRPNTP